MEVGVFRKPAETFLVARLDDGTLAIVEEIDKDFREDDHPWQGEFEIVRRITLRELKANIPVDQAAANILD